MKKMCLWILMLFFYSCEKEETVTIEYKESGLKSEQMTFTYNNIEIQAKTLPSNITRGVSCNQKKYNLILTSESLKKPIITQLVETLNNDGSFILVHYVEGVKVATLYFNKESELINIEVEEINATTRALPSNFLKCFNAKYSQLKKEYREFVGEFVADMTETMAAPSLAATAAADCAGMFDNIGIK